MELTFEASEGVSEAEKRPGRYSRESTIKQSWGCGYTCPALVEWCERIRVRNWDSGWCKIERGRFHIPVKKDGLYLSNSSESLEQGM